MRNHVAPLGGRTFFSCSVGVLTTCTHKCCSDSARPVRLPFSPRRRSAHHHYGRAMAKQQPLKLSDLRSGVDYAMGTQVQERRCLFHVKLTDFSMRSIEGLINSDKVKARSRRVYTYCS